MKQFFGYDSFHPGQEEIIGAILGGRDALAVMPTGAGKSICYQVPALMLEGITLVISPLISLMQDQVKALNAAGIHAAYINSALSEVQIRMALMRAAQGAYRIIYVAPERLMSSGFLEFARSVKIAMVTVDEAHCISQWGQDFRPSYMRIVEFIRELGTRPVISAFTATATEEVKEDIRCILGLKDAKVLVTGFDRPNLYFEVVHEAKKDRFVLDYVRSHPEDSGIIYCATRRNVDDLFELLFREGVSVARYHAGMDQEERRFLQNEFVYDRIRVMVATNAFGMGIDKSNVRYVLHYNMPQSIENYYQEAGRAGRDGEEASCILLFSPQDVVIDRFLLGQKDFAQIDPDMIDNIEERDRLRLRAMEQYCQTTECLRRYILRYFGERPGEGMHEGERTHAGEETYAGKETHAGEWMHAGAWCGNCSNCRSTFLEKDMTDTVKWILNCVAEARGRFGANIITGTLVGANRARLREVGAMQWRSYGKLSDVSEGTLKDLIPQLIQRGYLIRTDEKYSVLRLGPNVGELKEEGARVLIKVREETQKTDVDGNGSQGLTSRGGKRSSSTAHGKDYLTSLGYQLFEKLRGLRMQIAREQNLPPYIVFTDRTLIDMCVRLPQDEKTMLAVSGVARAKYDRYGEQFLGEIREFCLQHADAMISTFDPAAQEEEKQEGAEQEADAQKKDRPKKGRTSGNPRKADFRLSAEDAQQYAYQNLCYASEMAEQMNRINTAENMKKLTGTQITTFLQEEGLILITKRENGFYDRSATEKGKEIGITEIDKVSPDGVEYKLLKYPQNVQQIILEHFCENGTGDGSLSHF